ncbi:MAG TPA: response regulator transcription factor [Thermoleophilaceae bacterium]
MNGLQPLPASNGPILVVDPDAGQRDFVRGLLQRGGWHAETCSNGEQALASARSEPPVLALLEVRLGDMTGYELCHRLKAQCGQSLAVMFMSHDRIESSDVEAGLRLGADDYLIKPLEGSLLVARVLAVMRRVVPLERERPVAQRGELSPRELEVLQLLARGLDQGAIAELLVISPKTVSKHIEHVLEKLPARSRAEAVAIAYQRGLVRTPDEDDRPRRAGGWEPD